MKPDLNKRIVVATAILMVTVSALFFVVPTVAQESNVANAKQQYDAFRYTNGVTKYPYTSQYYDPVATATTASTGPLTNHTLWKLPLYRVTGSDVAYGRIWLTAGGPTNTLMCLNAFTGETIWSLASTSTLGSTSAPYFDPANDAATMGYLYVIFNGGLSCFRASDGALYWTLPQSKFQSFIANTTFSKMAPSFGPVGPTSSKYIYVADSDGNIAVGAQGGYHVWAISKGSSGGKIAWVTPTDNQTNYWSGGPMTLAKGVLYVGEYAANAPPKGRQFAYNATTGELMWSTVIGGVSTYGITVENDVVFTNISPGFDVPGGAIIALNANTGNILWRFNTTGIPMSNPVIVGNSLYQAAYLDDKLYCLDKNIGALLWSMDSPGGGRGATVANGLLYGMAYGITTSGVYNNGFFYCVDPTTNTLKWKYSLDNAPFTTNNGGYSRGYSVADGIGYAGDLLGTFYAFGKGPTTTEISVTDANIGKGATMAIFGKVFDESPASPGAPVVNSQVKLQIQKAGEATWTDAGTTTTDSSGRFSMQWTPTTEGTYNVMAKFDGSDDYTWSSSKTVVQINSAQSGSVSADEIADKVVAKLPAFSAAEIALIITIAIVAVLVIVSIMLQTRKPK